MNNARYHIAFSWTSNTPSCGKSVRNLPAITVANVDCNLHGLHIQKLADRMIRGSTLFTYSPWLISVVRLHQ